MSEPKFDPTSADFDKMEEAVMSTRQGRWFLKEFSQRSQVIGTSSVLDELSKLQESLRAGQEDARIEMLQSALREMANTISRAKTDIVTLETENGVVDPIVAGTSELDAVVATTERATSSILAATEELQSISEHPRIRMVEREISDKIQSLTADIFAACSFQDLTGQRLSKVIETMQFLEQRVDAMIEVWSGETPVNEVAAADVAQAVSTTERDEEVFDSLDEECEGFSQSEIDDMLAGKEPNADLSKVVEEDMSSDEDWPLDEEANPLDAFPHVPAEEVEADASEMESFDKMVTDALDPATPNLEIGDTPAKEAIRETDGVAPNPDDSDNAPGGPGTDGVAWLFG